MNGCVMHVDEAVFLQKPLDLIKKPVRTMLDEFNQIMGIHMVLDPRMTTVGTLRLDNIFSFMKYLLDMKEGHLGNA